MQDSIRGTEEKPKGQPSARVPGRGRDLAAVRTRSSQAHSALGRPLLVVLMPLGPQPALPVPPSLGSEQPRVLYASAVQGHGALGISRVKKGRGGAGSQPEEAPSGKC